MTSDEFTTQYQQRMANVLQKDARHQAVIAAHDALGPHASEADDRRLTLALRVASLNRTAAIDQLADLIDARIIDVARSLITDARSALPVATV